MKKEYLKRIISTLVYMLIFIRVIYFAFFYTSEGYNEGRARGGSIGILLLAVIIPIGFAIHVYRKTRSARQVFEALRELFIAVLDLPWQTLGAKLRRKSTKKHSGTTKKPSNKSRSKE
jgi:hypothetical protein